MLGPIAPCQRRGGQGAGFVVESCRPVHGRVDRAQSFGSRLRTRTVVQYVVLAVIVVVGGLLLSGVIASDTPLKLLVPFLPAAGVLFYRRLVLQTLGI